MGKIVLDCLIDTGSNVQQLLKESQIKCGSSHQCIGT